MSEERIDCPMCAESIKPHAKVCPFCSALLDEELREASMIDAMEDTNEVIEYMFPWIGKLFGYGFIFLLMMVSTVLMLGDPLNDAFGFPADLWIEVGLSVIFTKIWLRFMPFEPLK